MATDGDAKNALEYPAELATRFAPTRLLGRGAMGSVHEAMDRQLGRLVAVKLIDPSLTKPDDVARFVREGRLLATLNHPRVVRVMDAGSSGGTPFLVMELIEGRVLDRAIPGMRAKRPEVLFLLDAMLDALEYVHTRGIVHRDIKPGNVILHALRGPVLVDFGLAAPTAPTTILTSAGTVVGTIAYMAPEMIKGKDATVRCDIFATGLIGIEALTGIDVHQTRDLDSRQMTAAIVTSLLSGSYQTAAAASLTEHGALGTALLRAIALDPDRRFESAAQMRQAIAASQKSLPPPPPLTAVSPAQGGTVRRKSSASPSPHTRIADRLPPAPPPLPQVRPAMVARALGRWTVDIRPRIRTGAVALGVSLLVAVLVSWKIAGRSAGREPPSGAPGMVDPGRHAMAAAPSRGAPAPGTDASAYARPAMVDRDPIETLVQRIQSIEEGHRRGERIGLARAAVTQLRALKADDALPPPLPEPGPGWTREDQDRYERLVCRYELSILAARTDSERERCRSLFPTSMRPGERAPRSGRVFSAPLNSENLIVSDGLDQLSDLTDEESFLRRTKAHVDVQGLARAQKAFLVIHAMQVDPMAFVWVSLEHEHEHEHEPGRENERARDPNRPRSREAHSVKVALSMPPDARARILCHSIPPQFLREGTSTFKLSMDTLVEGACSIRDLTSFDVVLVP